MKQRRVPAKRSEYDFGQAGQLRTCYYRLTIDPKSAAEAIAASTRYQPTTK